MPEVGSTDQSSREPQRPAASTEAEVVDASVRDTTADSGASTEVSKTAGRVEAARDEVKRKTAEPLNIRLDSKDHMVVLTDKQLGTPLGRMLEKSMTTAEPGQPQAVALKGGRAIEVAFFTDDGQRAGDGVKAKQIYVVKLGDKLVVHPGKGKSLHDQPLTGAFKKAREAVFDARGEFDFEVDLGASGDSGDAVLKVSSAQPPSSAKGSADAKAAENGAEGEAKEKKSYLPHKVKVEDRLTVSPAAEARLATLLEAEHQDQLERITPKTGKKGGAEPATWVTSLRDYVRRAGEREQHDAQVAGPTRQKTQAETAAAYRPHAHTIQEILQPDSLSRDSKLRQATARFMHSIKDAGGMMGAKRELKNFAAAVLKAWGQ